MHYLSPLTELATIPPGAQIQTQNSLVTTDRYLIYMSTHAIYVYYRKPQIIFAKAIQVNNTVISAIAVNDSSIAAACLDMRIHFFSLRTFEPERDLLLARADPPTGLLFHPHFADTILLMYGGDSNQELLGELRSINIVTGQSTTIITRLEEPVGITCSPYKSEIAINSRSGHIWIYGIDKEGTIVYERMMLHGTIRVFEQDNGLAKDQCTQQQSEQSVKLIQLVRDYLNTQNRCNNPVTCCQIAYDPTSSEYFLAAWECGLVALFGVKSGELIQLFEPNSTGLSAVVYSQSVSGKFYTADKQSGIIREWNVSQHRCLKEYRICQEGLERLYIATDTVDGKQVDVLFAINESGCVYVVQNGKILFRSPTSHSQPVLGMSRIDDCSFLSASNDGACRVFDFRNFNGTQTSNQQDMLLRLTHYSGSKNMIQSQMARHRPAVGCAMVSKTLAVVGYEDGLILGYDVTNGRPVSSVFVPSAEMEQTFNDLIKSMIKSAQKTSRQSMQLRPNYARIKSMHYKNGLLFTGWRDGFIRIFRLTEIVDDTQGKHIASDFVTQIDLCSVTCTSRSIFHDITTLYSDAENLYVGTQSGIFAVLGLGNMISVLSKIPVQDGKQASTAPMNINFKVIGFWCSLNDKVQVEQVLTHQPRIQLESICNNRIINDIVVKVPTADEAKFLKASCGEEASRVVYLVDNSGLCIVLAQIGTGPENYRFKIQTIHGETFAEVDQIDTDNNVGLKFVRPLSTSFKLLYGGAEGCLVIYDWKQRAVCSKLRSTKADLSSCYLQGNLAVLGCFDGSIKAVSWGSTSLGISQTLPQLAQYVLGKEDLSQEVLETQFNKYLYDIESLQEILKNSTKPESASQYLSDDQLQIRLKAIVCILLNSFGKMVGIEARCSAMISGYLEELGAYYQVTKEQTLEALLQKYPEDISLDQYYICVKTVPSKQKVQTVFKMVMYCAFCLFDYQLATEFLWEVGLYNECVRVAGLVSKDLFKKRAIQLFNLRIDGHDVDGKLCQRWNLSLDQDDLKNLDLVVKCLQGSETDEELKSTIQVLVRENDHTWARTLALKQSQNDTAKQLITHHLAHLCLQYGRPIQAAYQYLQYGMIKDVVRILLMSGESLLLLYILQSLERCKGDTEYQGLKYAILCDWVFRYASPKLIEDVLNAIQPHLSLQVDPHGVVISDKVTLKDYISLWTKEFDQQLAAEGGRLFKDGQYDFKADWLKLSHFVRKLATSETYDEGVTAESVIEAQVDVPSVEEQVDLVTGQQSALQVLPVTKQVIDQILGKIEIDETNIQELALPISFFSKHYHYANIQCEDIPAGATKLNSLNIILLAAGCCVAKAGSMRGCRVFLKAANKSQSKFGLRKNEYLRQLAEMPVEEAYRNLGGAPGLGEFNGRSLFELVEQKLFPLFCSFDRQMNWVIGWLG